MSNLKFSRVVGRIKALNKCRNWPKGSPLLGDSLPKSGNFCHFLAPRSHPALRLTWNFARSSGPMCPSSVPNFKWIGASSRPCVAKCWFLIRVNFTGRRGNPAGKERERESCCRTVVLCYVLSRVLRVINSRAFYIWHQPKSFSTTLLTLQHTRFCA